MSLEGKAETNVLQGKISNSNYVSNIPIIDKTLTISGMSADAKVTGNKFAEINKKLNDMQDKIDTNTGTEDKGYQTEEQVISLIQANAPAVNIPENVSAFNNDANYATEEYVNNNTLSETRVLELIQENIPTVPIKLSELENDRGFLTTEYIDANYQHWSEVNIVEIAQANTLSEARVLELIQANMPTNGDEVDY